MSPSSAHIERIHIDWGSHPFSIKSRNRSPWSRMNVLSSWLCDTKPTHEILDMLTVARRWTCRRNRGSSTSQSCILQDHHARHFIHSFVRSSHHRSFVRSFFCFRLFMISRHIDMHARSISQSFKLLLTLKAIINHHTNVAMQIKWVQSFNSQSLNRVTECYRRPLVSLEMFLLHFVIHHTYTSPSNNSCIRQTQS